MIAEAPMAKKTSQHVAAEMRSSPSVSSGSPSQVTAGRITPLQDGQRGGSSGSGTVRSSYWGGDPAHERAPRTFQIDP
jgi:hypothetical protein